MKEPIRWAIIGLGRFGQMHARVLRSLPQVQLVAASVRSAEKQAAARDVLGISRVVADYRELLADPEIDAVSITTHWQQHCEIALAALAAGKHVLLEKPMAASTIECREILAAAARSTGLLAVGHICRFDPRLSLARQAVVEGRIGRIVSMHARRNLRKAPGQLRLDKISPLMGDGIHDVDLMLWLVGEPPQRVFGRTVRVGEYRYPDIGWAMLEFGQRGDGPAAVGVVETVWCLPESTPYQLDARLEVIGTEGALYVNCGEAGLAINDSGGWHLPDTLYWPTQHGQPFGALASEIAWMAVCIRRGAISDVMTPREAAQAVAVVEAAERSALSGNAEMVEIIE